MATNIYLFTSSRMLTAADGISIQSIQTTLRDPRFLAFTRDIRFDEDDVFSTNDQVTVVVKGITVFTGWLLDINPSLGSTESISYRAAGPRSKLRKIIFKKNGTARVTYNAKGDRDATAPDSTNWTYGQIFYDILNGYGNTDGLISNNYITKVDSTSILAMNVVAPEMDFINMTIDDCLEYIVEKAGKFGFYITPQKEIKVVNLSNATAKKVYIGKIGQKVSAHSEYNVLSSDFSESASSAKTKCTIEGSRRRYEQWVNLAPDWQLSLERFWNTDAYLRNASGLPDAPAGNYDAVFRRYTFTQDNILPMLISKDERPYTEWKREDGSWFPYQAAIDLDKKEVLFKSPIFNYRQKFPGTLDVNTAFSLIYKRADVRMRCVIEKEVFTVVVGPQGTAYTNKGIEDEIVIIDDGLVFENVARPNESVPKDDTVKMQNLATQMLEPLQDEMITGKITIDSLDLGWSLDNSLDIENADSGKWSNLNATIIGINLLPGGTESTQLQLSSNQYVGSGPEYAELKRRLTVGQKIKKLEEKQNAVILARSGSLLGETSNTGDIQSSGDHEALRESPSDQHIREVIQAAMNEDYFEIQEHDHTSASTGGDAYASKGSSLI